MDVVLLESLLESLYFLIAADRCVEEPQGLRDLVLEVEVLDGGLLVGVVGARAEAALLQFLQVAESRGRYCMSSARPLVFTGPRYRDRE
jgi:hypothetical protein